MTGYRKGCAAAIHHNGVAVFHQRSSLTADSFFFQLEVGHTFVDAVQVDDNIVVGYLVAQDSASVGALDQVALFQFRQVQAYAGFTDVKFLGQINHENLLLFLDGMVDHCQAFFSENLF